LDRDELKSQVDFLLRFGALAGIALYVAGFVIVTLGDLSYGVVAFSIFRTRVLAAGALFFVFAVFPILDLSVIFGQHRASILRQIDTTSRSNRAVRLYAWAIAMLMFFTSCWLKAFFGSFYLLGDPGISEFMGVFIIFAATSSVVLAFCLTFTNQRLIGTCLCFLVMGGALGKVLLKKASTFGELLAWCAAIALLRRFVKKEIKEAADLRFISWGMLVLYVLMLCFGFSKYFYPKVEAQFGGGKPVSVTLHLTGPPPIGINSITHVWLLDETDSGYYVLRAESDRTVVFVSRAVVSAVYFGEDQPRLPTTTDR
jgi:hypothetical protein